VLEVVRSLSVLQKLQNQAQQKMIKKEHESI